VLPARDAAATLAAALASVRRQSFADFECIVVDDGSSDATAAVARSFARDDVRFRLLERPASGLVATLNAGIAAARGPWLARMDADDLMVKRRLELQLAKLAGRPRLAGVGAHVRMFPRRGLSAGRLAYEAWLNSIASEADVRRERFVECPLAHPTWLVRTDHLLRFGYRDNGAAEDYDLLLRLLGAGLELGVVPERLLHWRDHPERASRRDVRYEQHRFTWLKAVHLSSTVLQGRPHYVLWGYGSTGKSLCHELMLLGHRPSYIVELHPGRLGQRIQGARVVEPAALAELRQLPLVVSVAGARARGEIRSALTALGFREAEHYVVAA
jgi:cellulose synthase/poly-beta-1,6-N-acetylglucosamine synthase-like glycosyltransferase